MLLSSISINNYKDDTPLNTIARIRQILHGLNISVIETDWKQSAKHCFSLSLQIPGTGISVNGKGAAYELAQASAYGELMERLQNQAYFRLNMDMSPAALGYLGFYYAPDEVQLNRQDLLASSEEWLEFQRTKIAKNIDIIKLMEKWRQISYEDPGCDYLALPFKNIMNDKISHIPIKMVSKMYMSNGMCAGNSREEALVQGICEVMERYANIKIVRENITPPTIDETYINKFPSIAEMLNEIRQAGQYLVVVKDCSLGMGLPVVGVQFINPKTQKYFIKFGAHPVFEIALARTLTELFQGQQIGNMVGVKDFSYYSPIVNQDENILNILVNGSGYYPVNFFSAASSYEAKPVVNCIGKNNSELLEYLRAILAKNGYSILVRDVSFLGFPSYHVIVPGFSEIEAIDNEEALDEYIRYNKVKRIVRQRGVISPQEVVAFKNFADNMQVSYTANITDIINISVDSLPWYYTNVQLFMCALYYSQGYFYEAYKAIDNYVRHMQSWGDSTENIKMFYKCLRDVIGAKNQGETDENIKTLLKIFYPIELVTGILTEVADIAAVYGSYGRLECWDCSDCCFQQMCSYPGMEDVYKKLKYEYAKRLILQLPQ